MFVAVDQCTAADFTEAENGGWKGPLEDIWSNPPAQGMAHLESVAQ